MNFAAGCKIEEMAANIVIVSILSVVILVANGAVCILVFVNRNLRTYTNGFIVSLAMSDILVGITLFLQYALSIDDSVTLNILFTTALVGSVANLTAVTLDRHLACTQPFSYNSIIAKYFVKIVVFCWITAVTSAVLPLIWIDSHSAALALKIYQLCILILGIAAPYTWIFLCYLRIYRQVYKIVKRERKMALSVRGTHQPCERTKRVFSEVKVAKVFSVIAVMFVLSWLPIIWTTLVHAMDKPHLLPKAMTYLSPFTLAFGSIINPILYSFMKPDFKHVCKKLLCLISFPWISFNDEHHSHNNDDHVFSRGTSVSKSHSRIPLQQHEETNI